MTAAMLLSKNLIGLLRPKASDDQTVALAKWLVPVVMLVAVYFTGNATIVAMLLVGYSFVTQLFPAVIASRMPRNPATSAGAFAGIRGVGLAYYATIGSLFPACGSNPRPQRRYHRACRKYRRVDRRQRSEQDAHSFGPRHVTVGRRSVAIGVLIRDDRR